MNIKVRRTAFGAAIACTVFLTYAMGAEAAHKRHIAQVDSSSHRTMKGRLVKEVVEADDLLLKSKFIEACDLYHDAINHDVKNVAAHTGMGLALGHQFKLDAADDEFNKALALDPKNATALAGKAMLDIYRLQSSSATVQKNREALLKDAESQARDALSIDSGLPEAHYFLGQALREQGRMNEAAQEFQAAIQSQADYADAYSALGMVRMAQNSPVEAAANFRQAIAINSGNSTAHYGLGKTLLQQGQIDDAIHEFNTALYQYPNSAPTRLALGEAYMQQGNTVAAVKEFQQAIAIKPENPDAYLHIAAIRENRGDIEHANAELRSGLELMPNSNDLHLRLADNSLRLEKLDDAVKHYSQVMQTEPQNAVAAKGLTRAFYLKSQKEASGAYFMSNQFENAKAMLDKAVAMNPNDMELRLAQAKLRALSGEQVDLKSVAQPRTDGERVAYAEVLLAQNRFADAHQQMSALISSAKDPKQVLAIGDLALMIKDYPSAESAYKRAATMPGAGERAKRGLDQLAKSREVARQDATLAADLARKNAYASAIDKYHAAIFGNPEVADSRLGLARSLEKFQSHDPNGLREAVVQYNAYLSLSPALPVKEADKINKHIRSLSQRATKLDQKIAMKANTTKS